MPNGRSGGFLIETADLKQLVQGISAGAVVGQVFTGSKMQDTLAQDLVRLIKQCPHDPIAVEEQDHAAYVIHFSNSPTMNWVTVTSTSPIFMELRGRHVQWVAEHPGWNGWMGL